MRSQVVWEAVLIFGAGVLISLSLSLTTFPIIFSAISRLVAPQQLSFTVGITMSVGSLGQFAMLPFSLGLIKGLEW